MLGPHIFGGCRVTFLSKAINCRQSACCCSLALDMMYSSTLASVNFVLFSVIKTIRNWAAIILWHCIANTQFRRYRQTPSSLRGTDCYENPHRQSERSLSGLMQIVYCAEKDYDPRSIVRSL